MDLQNKVAVVTGGASGLGLATVEKLVEKGAKVFIFDLNEKKAKDEALRLGDQVRYSVVDVSDDESVQHAIRQVIDTFGAIHICVNCAGIGTPGKTIGKKAFCHWRLSAK